eukprot:6197572-Pleurochrysis_carterae.AAC.2
MHRESPLRLPCSAPEHHATARSSCGSVKSARTVWPSSADGGAPSVMRHSHRRRARRALAQVQRRRRRHGRRSPLMSRAADRSIYSGIPHVEGQTETPAECQYQLLGWRW